MTDRKLPAAPADAPAAEGAPLRHQHSASSGLTAHMARRPHSREEAEERYVAARDAWTAAMRAARSGKPADLAALAMAQDAYEAALAEKQRWDASPRVPIPVGPDRPSGIEAVVGQELSRRRVQERERALAEQRPTGLRGLLARIRRR